jgi:hypothetical protein
MIDLTRFRLSVAVVLVAIAATAGFLAFALSRTDTPDQRVVEIALVRHYSPALVRRTFAATGIDLRYASAPGVAPLFLSATPLPLPVTGLYVIVVHGGEDGIRSANWGSKHAGQYDEAIGNLLVHYGGANAATLAAVKAAVASLPR